MQPPPTRLSVEPLEQRLTPTWGVPWYSPTTLSLSFAPDGADVSGSQNTLHSVLGPNAAAWEREILRAFQTWAIEANINIGLTSDGGQAFGIAGQSEGDPRFGDIRIGARPLSTAPSNVDLAATVGYDHGGGTWSGDMLLNSLYNYSVAGGPGQFDLFTVALHEASHSFGFADDTSNPNSVLWPGYVPRTGLAASDVAALRSLYGARSADAFEGAAGNGSAATAFDLTANGNLTAVAADVTTIGDADVYQFTTPSADSGLTGLTVRVQAAGISLLTPRVTVLDAQGNVLASAVTTDPLSNDLSVALPNYSPETTYFVRVEGAGTDVFSAGAYDLRLSYSDAEGNAVAFGNSFGLGGATVNTEAAGGDTLWTAQTLGGVNQTHSTAFAAVGSISNSSDADWYTITPTSLTGFTGTLTVGVVPQDQDTAGVRPTVAVFDALGNQLPAVVVANEQGAFTVQVADQAPGATYHLRVTAADPTGSRAVGGYALAANLAPAAVTSFDSLASATLTASADTIYSRLSLGGGKLVQFSLTASAAAGAPDEAVGLTVVDSAGATVFTLAARAGKPLATGTVWLSADTYTVVLRGATRDGSPLQTLSVSASMRERSDPMDPIFLDPNSLPQSPPLSPPPPPPPPPGGWFFISQLTALPPATPILDPIANPFLNLD